MRIISKPAKIDRVEQSDRIKLKRELDGEVRVFGPYEVYERLGIGGMATVHRAKERGIGGFERIVALKRLLPHLAEDATFVRSFIREAQFAALLNHPNVVQLYELGRVGHCYFISMEYIEGRDVRKVLRQARALGGPPPVDVAVALLIQTCEALAYAHTRHDDSGEPLGLIHRDVSPSNLLVNDAGLLKVIDFGIAKAQTEQLQTHTGRIKGKMAYMAPEVIRGLPLDARSDLFSAGVVAHELLTARPLFATGNDYETLQRVQNARLVPPSEHNPDCPPDLDELVLKALARDRTRRWQSAAEMRDALAAIESRHKLSASPRTTREWIDWAFASDAPPRAATAAGKSAATGSGTPATRSGLGAAPPPLEADGAVIEIAWEGRSGINPVLLDDIPDVSQRAVELVALDEADPAAMAGSRNELVLPLQAPPSELRTPLPWVDPSPAPIFADAPVSHEPSGVPTLGDDLPRWPAAHDLEPGLASAGAATTRPASRRFWQVALALMAMSAVVWALLIASSF